MNLGCGSATPTGTQARVDLAAGFAGHMQLSLCPLWLRAHTHSRLHLPFMLRHAAVPYCFRLRRRRWVQQSTSCRMSSQQHKQQQRVPQHNSTPAGASCSHVQHRYAELLVSALCCFLGALVLQVKPLPQAHGVRRGLQSSRSALCLSPCLSASMCACCASVCVCMGLGFRVYKNCVSAWV